MEKALVSATAGLIALTSAFATLYAKPVSATVHPTLDMVAVSVNQTENSTKAFKIMPSPLDPNDGTGDSLVDSLPVGNDYFRTFVHVSAIPKGTHTLVVKLVNPEGKVIATTMPDTFLSSSKYNDHDLTSSWKHVVIGSGYNAFKVFLDGRLVGTAQYWGSSFAN